MTHSFSVEYHPASLPKDTTVMALIDCEDYITPERVVEDFAKIGATIRWMMPMPTIPRT